MNRLILLAVFIIWHPDRNGPLGACRTQREVLDSTLIDGVETIWDLVALEHFLVRIFYSQLLP